jgi:hypothetical protein
VPVVKVPKSTSQTKTKSSTATKREPAALDPDAVPDWQRVSTDALESAGKDSKPMLIYFPDENDNDRSFADKELAAMSKDKVLFVKVPFTEDREKPPFAEESVVPTSKILSDNPSREYDVQVGKMTVIIADSYGNEFYRLYKKPTARQLEGYVEKVKKLEERATDKLQHNLDKAKEYLDKNDRGKALHYLLRNFKEGLVGVSQQQDSIRVYHDILDKARDAMDTMVKKGDKDGLKDLAKDVRNTDMESDVDEAIKNLS